MVDAEPPGAEAVPARRLNNDEWELLRSPLYATNVASGDIIRIIDAELGSFEVTKRGGNVCVQFYLGVADADDVGATARLAAIIESRISPLGGRIDGTTPGLISATIGVGAGFPVIDEIFNEAAKQSPDSQWQFANVYDPQSGEPLGWWE
ncbi:MAG: DUF4265 domain-containing protein [Proteobacteria bacterium]|nr:DUF4265 domain-containing protein [Pseudomonadota bacterium]